MGIGAGFAMGLVKGFTQNIMTEQQKRLSEREKVDAMDALVMEYTMKPAADKSAAGIDAARAMIKDARKQLADRDGIDIFGTASDGLDLDMATLSSTLDDVDGAEFYYGSGNTRIPVYIPRPTTYTGGTAKAMFGEFERIMGNDTYREYLKNDPNAWTQMNAAVNSAKFALIEENKSRERAEGEAFQPLNWNANQFSWIKDFNMLRPADSPEGPSDAAVAAQEMVSNRKIDPAKLGTVWAVSKPDGSVDYGPFMLSDNADIAAGQQLSIANLGNIFESVDSNDVFVDFTKPIQMPGMDDATLVGAFQASVMLGREGGPSYISGIETLSPSAENTFLYSLPATGPSSPKALYKKLNTATESTGSTFESKVFALYPYMITARSDDDMAGNPDSIYTVIPAEVSRQNHVMKLHYGTGVYENKSFGEMRTERDTNKQVMNDLDLLSTKTSELKAQGNQVGAYQQFKQAVFRVPIAFGQSFIADLDLSNSNKRDKFFQEAGIDTASITVRSDGYQPTDSDEKFLTEGYLSDLTTNIMDQARERDKNEPRSDGITYAELASLRLGLAFKMARAADPSGRLSNQDVQQALDRLGSDFDTVDQVLAKIQIVKREFESRYNKLNILVNYGEGTGKLTRQNKAVIDAAIAVDHLQRRSDAGSPDMSKNKALAFNAFEPASGITTADNKGIFYAYNNQDKVQMDENDNPIMYTATTGDDGETTYARYTGEIVAGQAATAADDTVTSTVPRITDPTVTGGDTRTPPPPIDDRQRPSGPGGDEPLPSASSDLRSAEEIARLDEVRSTSRRFDPNAATKPSRKSKPIPPRADVDISQVPGDQSDETADTAVASEAPAQQGLSLDDYDIRPGSGNNETGVTIIDKETGIPMQGKYVVKGGRLIPVDANQQVKPVDM
jgi:hypothetical protein